jgi:hypothetical protein
MIGAMVRALVVIGILFSASLVEAKPDFQNFTYKPGCLGTQSVRMKKGAAKKDGMTLAVSDVVEGDLDGDGKPEYVVSLSCDADEGTGRFTEAFIYRGAKPALVVALPTGDRAHGAINSLKIDSGDLVVERDTTSDGACCPEWTHTQHYKLVKNKLVESGLNERSLQEGGDSLSVEAIKFDKGKSGWTKKVDQDSAGSEFVFGAKAKQKLTATVTGIKGKPRLVVFDANSYLPLTIIDPDALTFTDTREADGAWHVLVVPPEGASDKKLSYKVTVSIE